MDNEEINKKLTEMEVEYLKLITKKSEIDLAIITVNTEMKQLRRSFKMEGQIIRTKKFRLTDDAKKIFLEFKDKKCELCGSKENIDIHHKTPLSQGGTNEINNLQVVCHNCHGKFHKV